MDSIIVPLQFHGSIDFLLYMLHAYICRLEINNASFFIFLSLNFPLTHEQAFSIRLCFCVFLFFFFYDRASYLAEWERVMLAEADTPAPPCCDPVGVISTDCNIEEKRERKVVNSGRLIDWDGKRRSTCCVRTTGMGSSRRVRTTGAANGSLTTTAVAWAPVVASDRAGTESDDDFKATDTRFWLLEDPSGTLPICSFSW